MSTKISPTYSPTFCLVSAPRRLFPGENLKLVFDLAAGEIKSHMKNRGPSTLCATKSALPPRPQLVTRISLKTCGRRDPIHLFCNNFSVHTPLYLIIYL